MKIFIMPPNSLILFDLVERFGHEPLSLMKALRDRVTSNEIEAPPLNVTWMTSRRASSTQGSRCHPASEADWPSTAR